MLSVSGVTGDWQVIATEDPCLGWKRRKGTPMPGKPVDKGELLGNPAELFDACPDLKVGGVMLQT